MLVNIFIETLKHVINMYSSEIVNFVDTRLRKLCVILRSRVLRSVHVLVKDVGGWRLLLVLASTRVNGATQTRSVLNKSAHGNYKKPF